MARRILSIHTTLAAAMAACAEYKASDPREHASWVYVEQWVYVEHVRTGYAVVLEYRS